MARQDNKDFCLNARAILAVRYGRELGERIAGMRDAPVGDLPQSSLNAMLRRLEVGEVTDGQDLVVLEVLHTGLAERMLREIVDSRIGSYLAGYDADGEIWGTAEIPVYSDRGEEARDAYERLERFLELRQQLLDRANAERLAARLLR